MTFRDQPWLASYAPGVPGTIEETTETLTDMMETSAERFAPCIALDFFGETTTYAELGEEISRAANGLRKLGVSPGDRVAIVLPNCPQHVVAFYAVLRLGAIVVEHNPLYTDRELRHQFEDHGAKVAIVWDKVYESVRSFPGDMGVADVVTVDLTRAMPFSKRLALKLPIKKAQDARASLTTAPGKGAISWESIVGARKLHPSHQRPLLTDTAVLQYTSGTTGTPKGAILSHYNLRANAAQGSAWVAGLRPGDETVYGVLPMFHAYGLTLCLTFAMSIGARLVLFPKFDEKLVLDAAKHAPPTFLPAVPPIYDRLVTAALKKKVSLAGIRFAISGAMNLPVSIVERWEKATGGLLVEGYGMTEASPIVAGNPIGPSRRPGTVGVPFPSTDIRVVDPDDPTVELGFEEEGELLVHGPQVFSGYWDRPTESAQALLPGGWLRTGDIVRVSADGFITVVDRMKELIITGGFNVSPSEVEEALLSHPDITDAAAVGLPSANGGEDVVAVVVLRPETELDVAAVREYCRTRLSAYKVPRRIVEVDDLPRSLLGKVLRREVRNRLQGK
ncbi:MULTISPECIES: long-chain-fatty-acid--CoA ligase [unclassified Cryobacterium]|uniref:long-chain-fatty-acid--CoA ligase n=1 Tax=unclassified Cryobacterium TaxID=2649013 RepID=UPI00106B1B6E|nr:MULTISPECIES: long-chain-fatty-acid--CoA ligase [unclassified Cryobacterium]TFD07471.1 long-chain fatty acid--CoA ligase [Cryobacterium sp. TMT1-66-1]TFD14366.1 long-chain fatty acid--CoA ligase [Cryobacterium sp. TMT1-2-2]